MATEAVVVGAGIGGAAAAVALASAGWSVTVLERHDPATSARGRGAGISLWPNALRALAVLGVEEALVPGATLGGTSGIRAPSGRWLAHTDLADTIRRRYGHPLVLTRRDVLLRLLRERIPAGRLLAGVTVDDLVTDLFTDDAGRPAVVDASGRSYPADLVVVADGGRSRLRGQLFPDHPGLRYGGYTTWRMLVPRTVAADLQGDATPCETWGRRGERFAILPVDADWCYCYATAHAAEGTRAASGDERDELRRVFGRWHAPIPQIITEAERDDVIRTDAVQMAEPLPVHHRGRVVLIGDAAHAMTPDLGQGGCQALEDAVTLGAMLAGIPDRAATSGAADPIEAGLARYSEMRAGRTADIVRRSANAGRIYELPPALARLAARIGGLAPASLTLRGLEETVNWTAPAWTATGDDGAALTTPGQAAAGSPAELRGDDRDDGTGATW